MSLKAFAAPLALGLAVTGMAMTPAAPATAATRKVPAAFVSGIVNKGLSSSKIHLNSHGSRRGNSYHKAKSSYVNLYGAKKVFTLPEQSFKLLKRRLYIYNVSNVNSRSMKLTPQGRYFDLTIKFESSGPEIKGMCRRKKVFKGWGNCIIGADKGAPDINWKSPSVKVRLVPQAYNGGIILRATKVTVGGQFQANGICRIGRDVCNRFTGYKSRIKGAVASSVKAQINSTSVKRQMATSTKRGLSRLGLPAIKGVSMSGGFIRVRY
ncbi:hypothetical protein IQ266_08525 [filamentous cyanobacterium LEGE 11480]|uniref:Uncharacterized protein n=1 Tax=Romeriopsis navalis LEGE 11480 TaxID=2777977 RepID=A0A928VNJ2_9CYAN|nr:hypothetical protein [Romeriopsis navalis]MBE9029770.1 hypothetical protein [Romeriopsis navalis LEGE 11480]